MNVKKKWAQKRNDFMIPFQAGFTLIELLVVVLIIAILAAVALPQYQVAVEKARVAKALPLFQSITNAMTRYELANGVVSADVSDLDIDFKYESKTARTLGEGYTDETIYYTGTGVGSFYVSSSAKAIWYYSPAGYTIDFFGRPGSRCYPHQNGSMGERVCSSFGKKIGGNSGGLNLYELY